MRIIIYIIACFWTVLCSLFAFFVCIFFGKKRAIFHVGKAWSSIILWLLGVKIDTSLVPIIQDKQKGGIILFNHLSYLDIPIIFKVMDVPLFFLSKPEIFKVPFLGWAMSFTGQVSIPRKDLRKSIQTYESIQKRLEKGHWFCISPEGTRGKDPLCPLKFKSGPFYFLNKTKASVVTFVASGQEELWPKSGGLNLNWNQKSHVQVKVSDPFLYEEANPRELRNSYYDKMKKDLASISIQGS